MPGARLMRRVIDALSLCGFRPFFLAAVVTALVAMAAWTAFLFVGLPLPATPGGPLVWHAHEMILGFGLAALAGFLVTAAPELTDTEPFRPAPVGVLVALWLVARLGFWVGGFGAWVTALAEIALLGGLLLLIAPRLWSDPARRHLAFFWAVLAMLLVVIGFHVDALRGVPPMRWLLVATGLFMVLIVLAMGRISMRIVNDELQAAGFEDRSYRSRPPRRNLAIFCISAFTIAEWVAPMHPVSGWLALAAAAALFNLMNDWHLGRVVFRRWIFMPYVLHWMLALGYLFLGLSILGETGHASAARHLLLIGALAGAALLVMSIAGRIHAGLPLETGRWLPLAVGLLLVSALARAATGVAGLPGSWLLALAAIAWIVVFVAALVWLVPIWLRARPDDAPGCAGPPDSGH
ncbi:MAG: NnrS family protein [Halothiobacillaceae bacterium]